jgi:hypothetical protein
MLIRAEVKAEGRVERIVLFIDPPAPGEPDDEEDDRPRFTYLPRQDGEECPLTPRPDEGEEEDDGESEGEEIGDPVASW